MTSSVQARISASISCLALSVMKVRERVAAADQHDWIIDAIEQHDSERAGQLVQEHWALSKKRMMDFVVPENLDVPIQF